MSLRSWAPPQAHNWDEEGAGVGALAARLLAAEGLAAGGAEAAGAEEVEAIDDHEGAALEALVDPDEAAEMHAVEVVSFNQQLKYLCEIK